MAERSASWFRNVAIGGLILSLAMIWPVETLQHNHETPLWLHIPLMGLLLTVLAAGALTAGVAWLEYQARSVSRGEKTK